MGQELCQALHSQGMSASIQSGWILQFRLVESFRFMPLKVPLQRSSLTDRWSLGGLAEAEIAVLWLTS